MDRLPLDIQYYLLTRMPYQKHHDLACVCTTWYKLLTKLPTDWDVVSRDLRMQMTVLSIPLARLPHNPIALDATVELFYMLCQPVYRPFFRLKGLKDYRKIIVSMCKWPLHYPRDLDIAISHLSKVIGVANIQSGHLAI